MDSGLWMCVCVSVCLAKQQGESRERERGRTREWMNGHKVNSQHSTTNNTTERGKARKRARESIWRQQEKKKKKKKTGHKREKRLWSVESQIQLQKRAKVKFGHTHHNRLSTTIRCFSSKRNLQKKKRKERNLHAAVQCAKKKKMNVTFSCTLPFPFFPSFLPSFLWFD